MKRLFLLLLPFAIILSSMSGCKKDDKDDDDNNNVQPEILDCSTISSSLTLVDRGSSPDYIISCRIIVEARLIIEPGVEIAFSEDAGLEFRSSGVLDAQGTSAKPIIMRGESPSSGFWRGIRFSSSNNSNKMYFTTVDGGGSLSWDGANIKANISLAGNSKVEIKNSTISNSAGDGIHVARLNGNDDALAGFDGNTLSGNNQYPIRVFAALVKDLGFNTINSNGLNKIEVHAGSSSNAITGNHSWTKPGAPIFINAPLDIASGNNNGTLTIGEGVQIEVGSDLAIEVNSTGALTINGTQTNPVEIRGEGGVKDYWKGIYVNSNNINNVFTYANISGGGSSPKTGGTNREVIRVGSSFSGPYRLTMVNCGVSNSTYCGIRYSPAHAPDFSETNTVFNDLGEDICNF